MWSATSRGRPPAMRDGGLALAVFPMVPRVPAAPNLVVHPPADLSNILLPPSSRPARLLRLPVVCPASSGDGSSIVGRSRRPPRASSQRSLGGRCRLLRLPRPRVYPGSTLLSSALVSASSSLASLLFFLPSLYALHIASTPFRVSTTLYTGNVCCAPRQRKQWIRLTNSRLR